MVVSKQIAADGIAAYLQHELTLEQLVDWAESELMDAELVEADAALLATILARLGVSDTRAFGLSWEDCEDILHQLGFTPRMEVVAAFG